MAGYNERLDGLKAAFLNLKLDPWTSGTRTGERMPPPTANVWRTWSNCHQRC